MTNQTQTHGLATRARRQRAECHSTNALSGPRFSRPRDGAAGTWLQVLRREGTQVWMRLAAEEHTAAAFQKGLRSPPPADAGRLPSFLLRKTDLISTCAFVTAALLGPSPLSVPRATISVHWGCWDTTNRPGGLYTAEMAFAQVWGPEARMEEPALSGSGEGPPSWFTDGRFL